MDPVRSADNARLKLARAVRAGQDREHLLLEGAHLLEEALAAGAAPRWVIHDERAPAALLARAAAAGAAVVPCQPRLLDEVSDLDSPRGLLALAERPRTALAEVLAAAAPRGLILVAAGVQDPGNLGALVRVAAGLGAAGFVALKGAASPWSPRALRGASGTTFRLPVAECVAPAALLDGVRAAGISLWGAAGGATPIDAAPRPVGALALLLGEEGRGLDATLRAACMQLVAIPLARGVESLNVATAAAVLCWALAAPAPTTTTTTTTAPAAESPR